MALAELALFEMHRPTTLDEVCRILAERASSESETVLLAGGTDWFVEQHMRPAADEPARPLVLDVSLLPELRGVSIGPGEAGDMAWIGAAATYLEIRRNASLILRVPALERMCRDVGAVQIQARGTLGGNLATASPAADGVCLLAALDATVVLTSLSGERKVPLESFYTGYKRTVRRRDELIRAVEIQLPRLDAVTHWRKVGTRFAQAISKVALGAVAELSDGRVTRVGLGMASVAPTTSFLPSVRRLLRQTPLQAVTDAMLDDAVLADIAPIDDIRSTAAYRRHVACALVRRFVRERLG